MENHETLMKDNTADGAAKVIAKGDIITTVTTEKKVEEEKAEQEDAQMNAAETPEATATTPLRQDTKVKGCSRTPHLRLIWILKKEALMFLCLVQREVVRKHATGFSKKWMVFLRSCSVVVFLVFFCFWDLSLFSFLMKFLS